MVRKSSKKNKDNAQNLFESEKKADQIQQNKIKETNVAYAQTIPISKEFSVEQAANISHKADNNISKINYLASSINFLSFLSNSLGLISSKIISSIEISFIISALKSVFHEKVDEVSLTKSLPEVLQSNSKLKEMGIMFFNLLSDKYNEKNLSANTKKLYGLLEKLLSEIDEAKKGKKTIEIIFELFSKSKETKKFSELNKFVGKNKIDEFSQLNDVADKLITLIGSVKQDDEYLQNWKIILGSYIWVLRYSTQGVETLIDNLLKKNISQLKELHIVLIGLFATKLFHSSPGWKPIGLSYQLYDKMKTLQPIAEVYYNPQIIKSLSSDYKKQVEYFWTYVWGKPYSIFEKPEVKEVKKLLKKQIEVEEEVIVEEKTFGNFITVAGESKPTGIIRIKTKI